MSKIELKNEYLRRSYTAVDGLWFVMLEQSVGFEAAMDIDHAVWQVMAKIQARKAAELCGIEMSGLQPLKAALALKFDAEQYGYTDASKAADEAVFEFDKCPWWDILDRAGRAHLAKTIAERICGPEFDVWAEQFGCKRTGPACPRGLCTGGGPCRIAFVDASV